MRGATSSCPEDKIPSVFIAVCLMSGVERGTGPGRRPVKGAEGDLPPCWVPMEQARAARPFPTC